MKVGIINVYVNRGRTGKVPTGSLHSGLGPLIAAFIPEGHQVHIFDESCERIDWSIDYDLLFLSSFHSDFDRARQISHYWRKRGAKTVYGGPLASNFPDLCKRYFDAIVVGDAEGAVPDILRDFMEGTLAPLYHAKAFDPHLIPSPRFELTAHSRRIPLQIEATRGCPFSCEFCILSALGSRFYARSPADVIRDIRVGIERLKHLVPSWRSHIVSFLDNNIGGNPVYLRQLCEALIPLKIHWATCITFNVLELPGMIELLAKAGCSGVYVGLETFNPATLKDMHKLHNRLEGVNKVIQRCLSHGIVLGSGMLISPTVDSIDYMQQLPDFLAESGLYIPQFICFESPFPGTPKFTRLMQAPTPQLLPNALLRDFDAYTLVIQPTYAEPQRYVDAYKQLKAHISRWKFRMQKLKFDLSYLVPKRALFAMGGDIYNMFALNWEEDPNRTYIAGTDIVPPEMYTVPFEDGDFSSQEELDDLKNPICVTDDSGRVRPEWRQTQLIYSAKKSVR